MYSKSNTLSIIPLPAKIERQAGQFAITPETVIVADAHNQRNAAYLQNLAIATPSKFCGHESL